MFWNHQENIQVRDVQKQHFFSLQVPFKGAAISKHLPWHPHKLKIIPGNIKLKNVLETLLILVLKGEGKTGFCYSHFSARDSWAITFIQINVICNGLREGTLTIRGKLRPTFTIWDVFLIGHTTLIAWKAEEMVKVLAWLQRKCGARSIFFFLMVLKDSGPSRSFTSL